MPIFTVGSRVLVEDPSGLKIPAMVAGDCRFTDALVPTWPIRGHGDWNLVYVPETAIRLAAGARSSA